MISERDIRDRIFKEFIAPTKVKKDYIGIEIEMPIINLNKKAVDFNVVHKVTNSFKNEFGDFKENGIDYDGNISSANVLKHIINFLKMNSKNATIP